MFLGAAAALIPAESHAHDAKSGWSYPLACCSSIDCAEIPASSVRETGGGYSISLSPEDHVMLTKPSVFSIAYDDTRIKVAPDGVYHACITRQTPIGRYVKGGNLICLFAPPKGF